MNEWMNECEIYFFKEGIRGLAFKGISHITDFFWGIDAPDHRVAHHKTQSESRTEYGLGEQLGLKLERCSTGLFLVRCQFPSFSRNSPTVLRPNQKAPASLLLEVHVGLSTIHVYWELNVTDEGEHRQFPAFIPGANITGQSPITE